MEFLEQFKRLDILKPGMDILDVGCYNGWLFQRLYRPGYHYDGVDIVDLIQNKNNLRFYQESFTEFIPDKKYDLIFARNVFMQCPDQIEQVKRYMQYLKSSGVMAVSLMGNNDPWVEKIVDDISYYKVTKEEVEDFKNKYQLMWLEDFKGEGSGFSGKIKLWHWYRMIIKNK